MQTAGKNNLIIWKQSAPLTFSGCVNGKEVFWTIREAYGVELFTTLADVAGENWENCGGALFMLICDTQEAAEAKSEEVFAKRLDSMGLQVKLENTATELLKECLPLLRDVNDGHCACIRNYTCMSCRASQLIESVNKEVGE